MRAPFQVIVLPFTSKNLDQRRYAVFRRAKHDMWQAISGGGEDVETPREAAVRETFEETGIVAGDALLSLDSRASIPVAVFAETAHWPKDLFVIPEYAFGLLVSDTTIHLSDEHVEVAWLPFREAHQRLTWDSNKVALWELEQRLTSQAARSVNGTTWGGASMTTTADDCRDIPGVTFVENGPVDVDQLNRLYSVVGWDRANIRTAEDTVRMLEVSRFYVSAHCSDLGLVGFARVCGALTSHRFWTLLLTRNGGVVAWQPSACGELSGTCGSRDT
jgi:dATP pyrophosphohydrolase